MNATTTKPCKFCLSEIPIEAVKCANCQEWQEKKISKQKIYNLYTPPDEFKKNFSELKAPFQLKIIRWIGERQNYYVTIFLVVAFLFSCLMAFWKFVVDENDIYLVSILLYSFQMFISWAGIIWLYNLINTNYKFFTGIYTPENEDDSENEDAFESEDASENEDAALTVFRDYHSIIFNRDKSLFSGLVVGASAALGEYFLIGFPFESDYTKIVYTIYEFIFMGFAGAALYNLFYFGKFIYKISKNTEKTMMNLRRKISTVRIGNMHLSSSILAVVPLGLGILAKLIGNWPVNVMVIIWYSIFAVSIIVYIYLPMVNIHLLIKKDIEVQIITIQQKIRKKLKQISLHASSADFVTVHELRALEQKTANQKTWPFNPKSVWAVFLAIIFPIVLLFLDKIWMN